MFFPRALSLILSIALWTHPAGAQSNAPDNSSSRPARPVGGYVELGPLLGDITATNAKFWIKASAPAKVAVAISRSSDLSDNAICEMSEPVSAPFFNGLILVTDLEPSTRYHYAVLLDGERSTLQPFPSFITAPKDGTSGRQRIAFASCVGYNGFDSAATWADLAARTNFDLLLMLGDNHYGDSTDPAKLFQVMGVQRRLPGYAEISRRVPQYAIWDNHDYGPEPADKRQPKKAEALSAFKMLWPNPAFGEPENPGVYFKFTRGDIDFFMLDDRYHRDPNNAPEDGRKSYLGTNQLAWLKRELLASKAKIKVLASGGEWQTYSQAASWASFVRERDDLFKHLEDNQISGVLLLSGDRHFTAAYQAAGRFIEVTSGPTGSKTVEPKPTPEMFWNGGKAGKFYCIFDVNTASTTPQITLEVYRTSDGLVLRREFTWEEVLGQTKIKPLPRPARTPE